MERIITFLVYSIFLFKNTFCDTEIHGKLFGRGVCSLHENTLKEINVSELKLYDEYHWVLCWAWPPFCHYPTGRRLFHNDVFPENLTLGHLFLSCCYGFKLNVNETGCDPICSPDCVENSCVDYNTCSKCKKGYSEPRCNPLCNNSLCEEISITPNFCNCTNQHFVCDSNLTCNKCAYGYTGKNCDRDHSVAEQKLVDLPCTYYIKEVSILISALLLSAVIIAIVMKKRICCNDTPIFTLITNDV